MFFLINEKGWTQKYAGDMNELHYGQYAKEKREHKESKMET